MLAGAVVRVLTMVAYPPALLFPDSWGYIATGLTGAFVGLPTVHPVGYPVLIQLLTLPDRSLAELVAFQHLAALGVGVAIYAGVDPRAAAPLGSRGCCSAGAARRLRDHARAVRDVGHLLHGRDAGGALVLAWPQLGGRTGRRRAACWRARLVSGC